MKGGDAVGEDTISKLFNKIEDIQKDVSAIKATMDAQEKRDGEKCPRK